uniref:High light inducible protein n=1 Tax=Rhodosorus marinus TaxID=101924 RepID=A0A7S0BDY9_9RHOD|mmetsp:Transcript_11941/g.17284  ORF Transcript_11941/g.17284 Transcript_11941/m.17284 type:complete len:112 (+) Transcript_11941:375-710(+)
MKVLGKVRKQRRLNIRTEGKMAFVNGTGLVGKKGGDVLAVSHKPATTISKRTVVSMGIENKTEKRKPGFNALNEQLNGRLAMMGFVIALATEIINPAHPTIVQQVSTLFGQ